MENAGAETISKAGEAEPIVDSSPPREPEPINVVVIGIFLPRIFEAVGAGVAAP